MKVLTNPCPVCGNSAELEVDPVGYSKWINGELIQRALPELDDDQRELLISGAHAHCWETLFKDED